MKSPLKENRESSPAAPQKRCFAAIPSSAQTTKKRKMDDKEGGQDDIGGYNSERAFRRGQRKRDASNSSEASQRTYQRSITPESIIVLSSNDTDSSSDSESGPGRSKSDEENSEHSEGSDEDFEHDVSIVYKINALTNKIGSLRKKLRTEAGVQVVADLSVPKTRRKHEVIHGLYDVVEKVVRPDVKSVCRNKNDKTWEPPLEMFRIKNVKALVVKGYYYVIPVNREFEELKFGHVVEVKLLTEDEETTSILEAKHIRNGKCIDARAFDLLEELIENLVEFHLGLKTFEDDDEIKDPEKQMELKEKAQKKYLNRIRNDIAIILPQAIWPKGLQDLFQGQKSGLLANPFNTRMLDIAEYLVMELLRRMFSKHEEVVSGLNFSQKKIRRIVKNEHKEITRALQQKVHGNCLDRWAKLVQEEIAKVNKQEDLEEKDQRPSATMGSLRKTIIHWMREILRRELKVKDQERRSKRHQPSNN